MSTSVFITCVAVQAVCVVVLVFCVRSLLKTQRMLRDADTDCDECPATGRDPNKPWHHHDNP